MPDQNQKMPDELISTRVFLSIFICLLVFFFIFLTETSTGIRVTEFINKFPMSPLIVFINVFAWSGVICVLPEKTNSKILKAFIIAISLVMITFSAVVILIMGKNSEIYPNPY